jgi:predicted glycosyltransferase
MHRFRPRVVLVDHQPQGKHRELVAALEAGETVGTRWVLGVRGIVGAVPQAASSLGRELFVRHYNALLWYGDAAVLGTMHRELLADHYQCRPVECGYVARLREIIHLHRGQRLTTPGQAGTISVPWNGEHGEAVLTAIAQTLQQMGPRHGRWSFFADLAASRFAEIRRLLEELDFCELRRPGPEYGPALLRSRTALVYGGYNSLTDVLAAGIPAVVLLRAMQDNEQQEHLRLLAAHAPETLRCLEEQSVTAQELFEALQDRLQSPHRAADINLNGAKQAARELLALLAADGSPG